MNSVAVICFNRPELSQKCIESLLNADEINKFHKILIFQKGNKEVEKVLNTYRNSFETFIEIQRNGTPTQNINANRYLAYSVAFENLHSDYTIVLEDDVQISADALAFADFVYNKYRRDKKFRAFNFGSGIKRSLEVEDSYSKVRYALQGPASLLPSTSWNHFDKRKLMKKSRFEIFDGTFETYIQTGFVIMPNNSRYIDFGYKGTHSNSYAETDYFKKLQDSWVGAEKRYLTLPIRKDMNQNWRKDCQKYRSFYNIYYLIRDYFVFNRENFIIGGSLAIFRKIKKLILK